MRHRKTKLQINRKKGPRLALTKQLAESVLLYEKVRTTQTKAKYIRPYVERLITKAKGNSLTTRRYLLQKLPTKSSVNKLIEVLGPRYKTRPGGYTRITKTPSRLGDGAKMAVIELV